MLGTDFPYPDWYPKGKQVIQIDERGAHIGRRTSVDFGVVADAGLRPPACSSSSRPSPTAATSSPRPRKYSDWRERQEKLADPDYDARGVIEKVRSAFDNPDERIRPEAVAVAVDKIAAQDAIFTTDTGMSTVWLSRFVTLSGTRRLIGSYNLGSMANAMPHGARRPGP